MTQELIAVDGCTIGHGVASPISGGVFTITSTPHTKDKINNKGIFFGSIQFTFTGGISSLPVPLTSVQIKVPPGSIPGTSAKTSDIEGVAVRLGDSASILCTGLNAQSQPVDVTGVFEVAIAGQDKVATE